MKIKLISILFIYVNLFGQNYAGNDLASKNIPVDLIQGSDAIARSKELTFKVKDKRRARMNVRHAVTILNSSGRERGRVVVPYDQLRHVRSLKGWLYDESGIEIRKLKGSDIEDYSATSNYSLYDDNRIKTAAFYNDTYPYTVVFEYEIEYKGLLMWPTWYPQSSIYPVEYTKYKLIFPSAMQARYHIHGEIPEPTVLEAGEQTMMMWELSSLPQLMLEPYGPSWSEQADYVITAPNEFEMEGYEGDMSSWSSFGEWYLNLKSGRDKLPPELVNKINALSDSLENDKDKVRRLYQYLQESTRYVSIQLGIGSWQPMAAMQVYQNGYGDCKALTNYMQAMLRVIGITSYAALINHGRREPDAMPDFPCARFDHIILFVPLKTDTLWLECTSKTCPPGHVGAELEDRYALVIQPEGSKLNRTPFSVSEQNRHVCRGKVILDNRGNGHAELAIVCTGNQQDRLRRGLLNSTERDQKKWLRDYLEIPSFELIKVDNPALKIRDTEIELPLILKLRRFAAKSGKRLFLNPNILQRWRNVPDEVEKRLHPVLLSYAFVDIDSITYTIPSNYILENAFEPLSLSTPFGTYQVSVNIENGMLHYHRRLEIRNKKLPPENYDDFRKFIAQVVRADRNQVVFVQK
jgi:transglutaminase-like putative cysteine protease